MSESAIEKTYALFAASANRKLVADLKNAGAKVFEFPPIEAERLVLDTSVIDKLKNLSEFDWLIFSDVLAADYFLETLEEIQTDLFEIDFLRTCALGEAVADRLRFVQIHADVIPSSIEIAKVFSAIADYIGETELENMRFLIAKEISAKSEIKEKLTESGATVFELPIYQAKVMNSLEITRLKTLLENGAFDEFIFTAPTDFIWLEHYFNSKNLNSVFAEIKVSAADNVSFQAAREHKIEAVGLFHLDKLDKVNR